MGGAEIWLLGSDETRLLALVLLNAAVLWTAWRAGRRINRDALDACGDAFLIFYLVQYLSVAVPGVVGILRASSMGLMALGLCAVIWIVARGKPSAEARDLAKGERVVAAGAVAFVVGYVALLLWQLRMLPVLSNDALTYHLPAAAQWLQSGKIGLYEAWFYNPANSYSPLAGSAFIAWLMAPLGNDALARFVGVGPLVMLLIAMWNLVRRIGVRVGPAAVIAAACVLARPFDSQVALAKDDLFVAAFFVLLIDSLTRERLETRFGPRRAGIALGLLLATKFTAILSLPIILLMLSRAWTMRRGLIIAACALLLAGPWYLRNFLLTGNPLYPTRISIGSITLLPGMLSVKRSHLLESASSAWAVFTGGYYAVPVVLAVVVLVIWAIALVLARRELKNPLARTAVLGPVVGIAIFVLVAPYGEMRFAYPSVALLFAAVAIAISRLPWTAQVLASSALMLLAAAGAFKTNLSMPFVVSGVVALAIGSGIALTSVARQIVRFGAPAIALLLALAAYVYWDPYLWVCEQDSATAWSSPAAYGDIGQAWEYIRTEADAGATIAYANTYFTYPLMGYRLNHRVVYVPTRADIARFTDMPAIAESMTGEEIVGKITTMLRANPDRAAWMNRLLASDAKYLVIGKMDPAHPEKSIIPPELTFAAEDPARFEIVFDNAAARVLRIRR